MERKGERIKMIGEMSGGGRGVNFRTEERNAGGRPRSHFVRRKGICGGGVDEWKREKGVEK